MLIYQKKLLMRLDDGEDGGEIDKKFFSSLQNAGDVRNKNQFGKTEQSGKISEQ